MFDGMIRVLSSDVVKVDQGVYKRMYVQCSSSYVISNDVGARM